MDNIGWELVDLVSRSDNWGDPDKMDSITVLLVDKVWSMLGPDMSIKIHCAYDTEGHSPKSQHYLAKAVDFHIEGCSFPDAIFLIESILIALQVDGLVGLGIYPEWNNPGFHLDTRGTRARWGLVGREYIAYDKAKETVCV